MKKDTLRELFKVSINAEREALALYSALAERFSSLTGAQEFFSSLAADEADHILGLARLLESLPPEKLDEPAPNRALALAKGFMNYSAESLIKEIKNLGDAYKKTVNLEFSEVNKLHELLFEISAMDSDDAKELQSVLRSHLDKVNAFKDSGIDMDYVP